jgi:AAA domain/CHC2 zinc finger
MSSDTQAAKQRLPLPALMYRLGLGEHAKKSARCPFHDDEHNSFSMWQKDGAWFWKCHAGCGAGDEINFFEKHKAISRGDAIKLFLEMAGCARSAQTLQRTSSNGQTTRALFNWRACVSALDPPVDDDPLDYGNPHLVRLGNERGFSRAFCSWLREKYFVGLFEGCLAFPVKNNGTIVGTHYKVLGDWRYHPRGIKTAPLIIGQLLPGNRVSIFESTWDGLDYMDKSGERDGIIITRGSENAKLVKGLIPEGSTVYVWPQNDAPGEKWAKNVCASLNCAVKRVKIPAPHKDLNDWTRAGAAADDLLAAMVNANDVRPVEAVGTSPDQEPHETETNWLKTIDAATVGSSELASLTLSKRRQLLGDWLCEGDYGIIFAPRGVGKTWLGLMIAKAVATGGEVGEWKAPTRAKVLYIDGEMPPDLMRDRDKGLGRGEVEFLNHAILFDRARKVLNITEPPVQQAILQRCLRDEIRLVILDNLSTLASGIKENDSYEWERLHNWLLQFRRHKIAVILIHHAGRSGEIRGTSKREDAAFWVIALDDARKQAEDQRGARFISRFTKPSRNTQDEVLSFEWHIVTDMATSEVSVGCKPAQTMDVFLGLIEDGVTECSEIAEEMKVSKASVSRMAKQAMKSKKIIKVGREYFLAEGAKNDPKP